MAATIATALTASAGITTTTIAASGLISAAAGVDFTGATAATKIIKENGIERGRINSGVFQWGTVANSATLPDGSILTNHAGGYYAVNTAGTDLYLVGRIDDDNAVALGGATSTIETGQAARLPFFSTPKSAAATLNGLMYGYWTGTTYYFVGHANGQRFRVAGASF